MSISKEAEQRIYDGLTKVSALMKGGLSPNAAIIKVAKEDRLPAGHIKLMSAAINTGRTNKKRKNADSIFDKVAEFDLADPAVILRDIYPETVKSAAEISRDTTVSSDYEFPPEWMAKKARLDATKPLMYDDPAPVPYQEYGPRFIKKADGAIHRLQLERDRLRHEMETTFDKCTDAFGDLQMYFKSATALPFDEVAENAASLLGKPAESLFDKLANGPCCYSEPMRINKNEKPKEKKKPKPLAIKRAGVTHSVDIQVMPYSAVKAFMKAADEHNRAFQAAAEFEKHAAELELKLGRALSDDEQIPLAPDPTLSILRRLGGEKRAFVGPAAGTLMTGAELGLGSDMGRSIVDKLRPKPKEKLEDEAAWELSDPTHEAKLRAIRAQSALHGILNGPYFEGEDPRQTTELFNKLTKLSPRGADQPLLLEAAMRRLAAQGVTDPHDIDQLLGIETKIKMRDRAPKDEQGGSDQ